MMMGSPALRASRRNCRAKAMPDIFGSIQSISTMSGSASRKASAPSSAEATMVASKPAFFRVKSSSA